MDGIHDLGGRQGFGPVVASSADDRRAAWEDRVFALVNAAFVGGLIGNIDQFRHGIERIDPRAYLLHGYFGRWLGSLETLLAERGDVTAAEIDALLVQAGRRQPMLVAARPMLQPDRVGYPPASAHGMRALDRPPLYQPGQQVRTLAHGSAGHTRLPQYARGRVGEVIAWHDGWVYPDSNAHGLGEDPQHLYTVRFSGESLWGEAAEAGTVVHLDLFEPYLEPCVQDGLPAPAGAIEQTSQQASRYASPCASPCASRSASPDTGSPHHD